MKASLDYVPAFEHEDGRNYWYTLNGERCLVSPENVMDINGCKCVKVLHREDLEPLRLGE